MIRTQSLPRAYQTAASKGRHEIVADAPIDNGGGGTAFGAHELLEASLAICINRAVRMHAAKHPIPLDGVTTQVKLQRPTTDRVVFEYSLELSGVLSAEQRVRLDHAAFACTVRQTLSKQLAFEAVP